ncbi:MAG: hypothetical protein FWG81_07490 [Betaproteobacteria bacterium]|nr:hypothetical protein [Betaproteobacteria bacterium]
MRKWESGIFRNNHLRMTKCHFWLFVLYMCTGLILVSIDTDPTSIIILFFWFSLALIHILLSYGSYKKIEIARRISEFVFATYLLGFPVGTFLAMYLFLPATLWKNPEAEIAE